MDELTAAMLEVADDPAGLERLVALAEEVEVEDTDADTDSE